MPHAQRPTSLCRPSARERFQGWARGAAGEVEAGLADMRKGLQAKRALGAELKVPYYFGVMAGLCTAAHRADESVELLDTAGQSGRDGGALVRGGTASLEGGGTGRHHNQQYSRSRSMLLASNRDQSRSRGAPMAKDGP
jgi:hypothetical protein